MFENKSIFLPYFNIVLGVLAIVFGIVIIKYYENLKNKGGLSFKLRNAGIGLIMLGIALILREFGLF